MRHSAYLWLLFFFLALLQLSSSIASAQIVKVGLTYMSDELMVIPVPSSLGSPGLFVAVNLDPNHKFRPQEATLDFSRESVATAFIRYKDGRYPSLVLPNPTRSEDSEIRIAGDFSLKIGPTVTVAVSTANNPWYLSVSLYAPGKQPEILGFLGTNSIVKARGPEPTSLLQANQFSATTTLTPYVVAFDRVLLNDKPITAKKIGVPLSDESQNPCFEQDAHILDEENFERYRQSDLKTKLKLIRQADARNNPVDFVILSSNARVKTVYDVSDNRFGLVRSEEKNDNRTVCSFTPLRIE